ncbi:MAG: cell division protein FtsA [Wolinella sp.]
MNQTILGIDIGSVKICAIIAEVKGGVPHVIGTGVHKSQGLKKGAITNIEFASRVIKNAVNDAKRVAGTTVSKGIVSISGVYTKSINSSAIVNVPNGEIGIKEINRVMQTALYNAKIPNEYDVIHVLPYNFKVDDQDFIDDPLGMSGNRLEVFVHIVTAQRSSLGNLKKAVKAAGVEIENIVLKSYSSAIAVLSDEDKELGVACIDMGGSTCELMVHVGNSIKYNDCLKVGSHHITNDLSMALHTPLSAAEEVKVKYGSLNRGEDEGDIIELPMLGDESVTHQVSLKFARDEVIYERTRETLKILDQSLQRSMLKEHLGAGIVLTGGMVKLEGIRELAEAMFLLPVRLARPIEIDGLFENLRDPSSATAIGLILYGAGHFTNYEIDSEKKIRFKTDKISGENIPISSETGAKGEGLHDAILSQNSHNVPLRNDLSNIAEISKNGADDSGVIKRIWHWLTQLF